MTLDKELLKDFIFEMRTIEKELKRSIYSIIKTKMQDPSPFEGFGQAIDRVYGTAMTLGMEELGLYCKSLKDATYMASASDNERGKEKTCRLMLECINLFSDLCEAVHDPDKLSVITLKLNQQKGKVAILNRKEFFSVKKVSCD